MTPGPGRWRGRRPGTLTRGARCFLLCTARHPPPALCPLQVPRAGGTGVLAPLSEVGRPAGGAAVAALCVGGTPGEGAHSVTGGCPTAARAQGAGLGGCRARGGGQLGITPRPPRGAPAAGRAALSSSARVNARRCPARWPLRAHAKPPASPPSPSRWCSGVERGHRGAGSGPEATESSCNARPSRRRCACDI